MLSIVLALQTIDGEIAQQLAIRRNHREGVGPAFFDASMYTQGHMGVLPEALRPKPGRLSLSQQRVYEDFVRLPWQNQSIHNSAAATGSGLSRGHGSASVPQSSGAYSSGLGNTGIGAVANSQDLGTEETESTPTKLHSISSIHVGVTDDVSPHNLKNDANVTSSPSAPAPPELHSVEPTNVVNETGASVQPLASVSGSERLGSNILEPLLTTGDALDMYHIISEKLETSVSNDAKEAEFQVLFLPSLCRAAVNITLHAIISEVPGIILRCISRDEAALAVAQKVFKGLYENASNSAHVDAHLAILSAIRDVSKLVVKELTSWVIYSDEDRKFNKDITVGLIRSELLNLAEYNVHMAKLLDAGRNKPAAEFAVSLLRTLVTSDSRVISELHYLVDALAKLAARPGSPESLQQLVEIARNPTAVNVAVLPGLSVGKDDNTKQSRDKKATGYSAASRDDYNPETADPDPAAFRDQVSMLFAEWYRICELPGSNDAACAHFILQLTQSGLLKGDDMTDHYFRSLMEISVSHCLSSEVNNSSTLQLHPQAQPPLSFLAIDIYAGLILSILKFFPGDQGSSKISLLSKALAVTVRYIQKDAEEKKSSFNSRPYYRLFINWLVDLPLLEPIFDGVNFQVLTALANAFHFLQPLKIPGFSLCDVIPSSCIQMRNIILSAFPRNMRLPDPSTPNLKIDLLVEINQSPRVLSDVDAALKAKQMKNDVDEYLKTRQQGSSFVSELKQKLLLPPSEAARSGTRYNVPLINSLVLYVGMQAIQQLQARTPPHQQTFGGNVPLPVFLVGAALDIFQTLIVDFDTEGRYLFLNAIANQLRYPNTHTHYFSFVILYLFTESHQNPRYNFWSRSFTRCAPEIEKLFESVSRSCGGPKPVDDGVAAGGINDMH
ncbi:hypothetical protein LguiA_019256 [Lonicera macranthoides]